MYMICNWAGVLSNPDSYQKTCAWWDPVISTKRRVMRFPFSIGSPSSTKKSSLRRLNLYVCPCTSTLPSMMAAGAVVGVTGCVMVR